MIHPADIKTLLPEAYKAFMESKGVTRNVPVIEVEQVSDIADPNFEGYFPFVFTVGGDPLRIKRWFCYKGDGILSSDNTKILTSANIQISHKSEEFIPPLVASSASPTTNP